MTNPETASLFQFSASPGKKSFGGSERSGSGGSTDTGCWPTSSPLIRYSSSGSQPHDIHVAVLDLSARTATAERTPYGWRFAVLIDVEVAHLADVAGTRVEDALLAQFLVQGLGMLVAFQPVQVHGSSLHFGGEGALLTALLQRD
jgi:hypothetical protein